jgi:hypothetical protein
MKENQLSLLSNKRRGHLFKNNLKEAVIRKEILLIRVSLFIFIITAEMPYSLLNTIQTTFLCI